MNAASKTAGKVLIEVKNVVKKFKAFTAVDNISFKVYAGECLGVLGPNGAGKTTTVRMIQCISPITSGEICVDGKLADLSARSIRAILGVVPQENDLDRDLTLEQNLNLFAKFFDIPGKVASKRVKKLLDFAGLTDRKSCLIEELSGGMKQRLLIARALMNEPKILILDEPTIGLDPQARHMIWQKLRALKEEGVTMILTTHYMDEAFQLCDRLLIIDKGKILKEGIPQQLVETEIGREVVEVRKVKKAAEITALLKGLTYNQEKAEDVLYLYCQDSREILARLAELPKYPVLRREATLEDLFLKLTGRGLDA